MLLFAGVAVLVTVITSALFYLIAKKIDLCKKSLMIKLMAYNAVFCVAFPAFIAVLGGETQSGVPSRGLAAVFSILAIWTALYIVFVIWRVILRSGDVKLKLPVPVPETHSSILNEISINDVENLPDDSKNAGYEPNFDQNAVDTVLNVGKMGIVTEQDPKTDLNDVNSLINLAFDSLYGGKLEEAAEYFYNAIDTRPPLNLEVMIAIQLCMIFSELGRADLSYDILTGYNEKYREQLSDEDRTALEYGVNLLKSVVTGIGGDGYEKN